MCLRNLSIEPRNDNKEVMCTSLNLVETLIFLQTS